MGARGRMADALLRATGGRTVLLRIPAPAMAGDVGEQLGLGVPGFQDVELGPAVFRKLRARVGAEAVEFELLISATSDAVFRDAVGVVVDGVELEIVSVTKMEAFGEALLTRVGLRGSCR